MPVYGPNDFDLAASGDWSNPTFALSPAADAAEVVAAPSTTSGWLKLTDLDFDIVDTDTIEGIEILVTYTITNTVTGLIIVEVIGPMLQQRGESLLTDGPHLEFALTKDGTNPAGVIQPSQGGSGDLWGTTWTFGEIEAGTMGAFIRLVNPHAQPHRAAVQYAQVKVYTQSSSSTIDPPGGGGGNIGGSNEMDGSMLMIPPYGKEVM